MTKPLLLIRRFATGDRSWPAAGQQVLQANEARLFVRLTPLVREMWPKDAEFSRETLPLAAQPWEGSCMHGFMKYQKTPANLGGATPLLQLTELAAALGIGRIYLKDESKRDLGNFKSLGGYAVARQVLLDDAGQPKRENSQLVLLCASDGNHGLAVAAAAMEFGVRARIYLPRNVSQIRSKRITHFAAEIAWVDGTYDDAVKQARAASRRGEGILVPDTTDKEDDPLVRSIIRGYQIIGHEAIRQLRDAGLGPPSHVFIQAGVGGLAAAMAEALFSQLRSPRAIVVVEPEQAACVQVALSARRPVQISGDLHTAAEMLSCGIASAPAVKILLRYGAKGMTVSEDELDAAVQTMKSSGGPVTTPSGAAGLAGLIKAADDERVRELFGLTDRSCALLIASEGAAD